MRQKKNNFSGMGFDRLADAELDIMRVLWNAGEPLKVSEIVEKLSATRSWKTQTAHVLLKRLEEGGFVSADKSGYSFLYSPVIDERTYIDAESRALASRTGGSLRMMIASLIDSDTLTSEDIDELDQIIERKRSELKGGN